MTQCRDAAGCFLFERLETLSADCRPVHAQRPARFCVRSRAGDGGRPRRAEGLTLAVEIDGYYHFQKRGCLPPRPPQGLRAPGTRLPRGGRRPRRRCPCADPKMCSTRSWPRSQAGAGHYSEVQSSWNRSSEADLWSASSCSRGCSSRARRGHHDRTEEGPRPLLGHRLAGAALADGSSGARRPGFGRAGPPDPQGEDRSRHADPEGGRRALEFLGIDRCPPRPAGVRSPRATWRPARSACPRPGTRPPGIRRRPGVQGRAAQGAVRPADGGLPDVRPGDRCPGVEAAGVRARGEV